MLAWVGTQTGPKLRELPKPTPTADQVLVRVRASALNRADLFMASGGAHGPLGGEGAPLGLEWAGEIVETGERVMGTGAGHAQFAAIDRFRVTPIPAGLSFEDAAGLSVALQTMHNAIVTHGELQPGQSILIHGASSGVGLMALQIARLRGAGVVIGSSGDPERRAQLAQFGADIAVDYRNPDWVETVKGATGGKGADIVIDQISGGGFNQTMKATKVLGRIVNVGRLGGQTGEVDFNLHALKRITYVGVTFRSRSPAEIAEVIQRMRADLWPALEAGQLRLPVDRVYPFKAAPEAFARMSENRHFGKIVLQGVDDAD